MGIEPLQGSPMLLTELLGHPHNSGRLRASGVGEDLAEMAVVDRTILVFDDHSASGRHLPPDDV
jgi:hypothetical protein